MFSVFSESPFDTLVDEATSELLPGAQEDLTKNMEICDAIKGRAVPPANAVRALRRRLTHYNPNVQLLALKLTDACVKNCGRKMLRELASRDFVDTLISVLSSPSTNTVVRDLAASLFQQWAIVFGQYQDLAFLQDAFETFKREHPDIKFPPPPADLAIDLVTETREPPEWTDSGQCERCKCAFTVTNRKHHCRACGHTFCGACSGKSKPIPEYGYTQPVRAEEEAQLQAAIAASKAEIVVRPVASSNRTISAVERENIHLFSRLLDAADPAAVKDDPEMVRMAREMRAIRLRIEEALLASNLSRTDKEILDRALKKYESTSSIDVLAKKDTTEKETDKIKDLIGL